MNRLRLVFYICLLSSINYCFSQSIELSKLFTSEELLDDVDYLFDHLEQIHPDLYKHLGKDKVNKLRANVCKGLNYEMDRKEFSVKIIPLITALKDGHTSLPFPYEERTQYIENGGLIFPFDVFIFQNRIYIKSNFSSDSSITIGSEIIAINGFSSKELLTNMMKYYSGELDHFRAARVEKSFGRYLWYLYNLGSNFSLELKNNASITSDMKNIKGITAKNLLAAKSLLTGSNATKPFSYYQIKNNSIGVIEFNVMNYKNQFKYFLDSTFTAIQKQNIEYLIIDIRKNGGGNSQLSEMLFEYITKNPYKMLEKMEVKISNEAKRYVKKDIKWYIYPFAYPLVLFVPQARPYFYGKNGNTKVFNKEKETAIRNNELSYTGKTYLLTSHYTFSSAAMLANVFQCYNMGMIIGQETGGVSSPYGDIIAFTLPNTKLRAYSSHKKFVDVCHKNEVSGVIPDIIIDAELKDIQSGIDLELSYVINSIIK